MNNKIKLIGLFNESAANEEMPKRIKFEGDIFELDEDNVYKSSENGNFLTDSINFNLSNLNDYVEILEDEEDNDISSLNAFKLMEAPYMAKCLDKNSHEEFMEHLKQSEVEIVHKIGELIEKVNKLDKKINKEE